MMDDAILVLRLAVRDAERIVACKLEEANKLEEEIATLEGYLTAAQKRYEDAADWLDGIMEGLETLEKWSENG